jgi:hypothetical protein
MKTTFFRNALCTAAAALLLPLVAAAQPAKAASPATAPLTDEERAAYRYMAEKTKHGFAYRLDLKNDLHWNYVMSMLRRGGESPERSPNMYKRLQAARGKGGATTEPMMAEGTEEPKVGTIVPLSLLEYIANNDVTATGSLYSSYPNASESTSMTVNYRTLTDSNPFYYSPTHEAFGDETKNFQVFEQSTLGEPQKNQVIVGTLLTIFFPKPPLTANARALGDGDAEAIVMSSEDAPPNATSICPTAPNYALQQTPQMDLCPNTVPPTCIRQTTPRIVSCYGRNNADCNYVWGGSGYPSKVPLAIAGSMTFPYPIVTPLQGQLVLNLQLGNGGCYLLPPTGRSQPLPPANMWVDPNDNKVLRFCFQAQQFNNNGCLKKAEEFVDLNMSAYVTLLVPGDAPNVGQGKITSNAKFDPHEPWFQLVPQLRVLEGCFATGTKILMADGTWRPVEEFRGDHTEVVAVDGGGLTAVVTGTISGYEDDPMYRITDDKGNSVLISENHPMPTGGGVKLAYELRAGDTLTTREGTSRIAKIDREIFELPVKNLMIGDGSDAAAGKSTVIANGIVSGDGHMQSHFVAQKRKKRLTKEEILADLPKEWHQDYLNELAAAAQRKQ